MTGGGSGNITNRPGYRIWSNESTGIGFAFAKACHSKGARVLIGDLKLTKEAEEYVSKSNGSDIAFQKCDVSSWDDLHNLISASVEKFKDVPDVLVEPIHQQCSTLLTFT